jgi:hypothetical protein
VHAAYSFTSPDVFDDVDADSSNLLHSMDTFSSGTERFGVLSFRQFAERQLEHIKRVEGRISYIAVVDFCLKAPIFTKLFFAGKVYFEPLKYDSFNEFIESCGQNSEFSVTETAPWSQEAIFNKLVNLMTGPSKGGQFAKVIH